MKKILLLIFFIILISVLVSIYNQDPQVIINGLNKDPDGPIRELKYRISLAGVIPAGEAVFKIGEEKEYQGRRIYQLNAFAKSLNIFSKLFNGYADLYSYIDAQSFNPILFRQKLVVKGKKDIEKEVTYDQANGTMSIEGVKRQIFPNTQDPLSAMFNLRRIDLGKTNEFEFNINTNQKNYILRASRRLFKDVRVKNKTYKTALLDAEISRRDKNPYHKSKITMVLLKGKVNTPILIKVFAGGFYINARLIDIQ